MYVANPSKPSVKLTAFEAPIITNIPKGIKNNPICKIKFLKMESIDRIGNYDQKNLILIKPTNLS